MRKAGLRIPELLRQLESFYGQQEPCWPTDPYLFLVWWHCGYPASDAACAKGWESLNRKTGVEPQQLLGASPANLASALRPGGMVPEIRAPLPKSMIDGELTMPPQPQPKIHSRRWSNNSGFSLADPPEAPSAASTMFYTK